MLTNDQRKFAPFIGMALAGLACIIAIVVVCKQNGPEPNPRDSVLENDPKLEPGSHFFANHEGDQSAAPSQEPEPNDGFVVNADFQVGDLPSYPEFQLVGFTQDGHQQHPHNGYGRGPVVNHNDQNAGGSPPPPARFMMGVDGNQCNTCVEPRWKDATMIPWERFSYGEYIGPHRTPHVPEYRIRVRDQLEFVFMMTREQTGHEYRFGVGDSLAVVSSIHVEYNQPRVLVLSDGSISLPLIGRVTVAGKSISVLEKEINDRYIDKGVRMPQIVVQGIETNRRLQDLRDAVDARAGVGGQSRAAEVGPDGTIQLPLIHSVPAIGLTLKELAREVNARYREKIDGIEVTPILVQRAPRVAYVVGEVVQPGRIDLLGPTSVMQSIALAQGWNVGANLRQVIVFRRDQNWNLMATRLDLSGALWGKRPHPSDEIWLRDGDIVLIPKQPILRLADAIDLYFTRTLFAIVPNQGFALNFDSSSGIN